MFAPPLSSEEFASLVTVGLGDLVKAVVPPEHLLKLVGYRYIRLAGGRYEVTATGEMRIRAGSGL